MMDRLGICMWSGVWGEPLLAGVVLVVTGVFVGGESYSDSTAT